MPEEHDLTYVMRGSSVSSSGERGFGTLGSLLGLGPDPGFLGSINGSGRVIGCGLFAIDVRPNNEARLPVLPPIKFLSWILEGYTNIKSPRINPVLTSKVYSA